MVATSLIFDFEDRSIGCKVNFKQMHFGRITDRITSLKNRGIGAGIVAGAQILSTSVAEAGVIPSGALFYTLKVYLRYRTSSSFSLCLVDFIANGFAPYGI